MPTYEYECAKCGDRFDVFQRMSDEPLKTCEKCGGALRKVFSPVGIVFKGSGFYVTDSRKNGSSTSTTKAAPTTASKPAETPAPSSETKPAGGSSETSTSST